MTTNYDTRSLTTAGSVLIIFTVTCGTVRDIAKQEHALEPGSRFGGTIG